MFIWFKWGIFFCGNQYSSFLLRQFLMSLGLLRAFVTVSVFEVGSLAPCQGLHFACPLRFDLFGMGGSVRRLNSHQRIYLSGPLGRSNLLSTTRRKSSRRENWYNSDECVELSFNCLLISTGRSILLHDTNIFKSRDSAVSKATSYWLEDRGSEFESRRFKKCSLLHVVQIGSGVHPTSYPMGTGGSFPGGKAVGAWSWPLTSN
jgi:hypothetical protein